MQSNRGIERQKHRCRLNTLPNWKGVYVDGNGAYLCAYIVQQLELTAWTSLQASLHFWHHFLFSYLWKKQKLFLITIHIKEEKKQLKQQSKISLASLWFHWHFGGSGMSCTQIQF